MIEALLKEREILIPKIFVKIIGVSVFVILTAFGAYVYIPLPFTPVPITLQTLFVFLSGIYLGASLGSLSQFIYVLLGITGLPIFAMGREGLNIILGPTGGYLVAFPIASFIAGKLISENSTPKRNILSLLLSLFIIYFSGSLGLALFYKFEISFKNLLFQSVFPFIPGDILKILLVIYPLSLYTKRARSFLN